MICKSSKRQFYNLREEKHEWLIVRKINELETSHTISVKLLVTSSCKLLLQGSLYVSSFTFSLASGLHMLTA